MRIAPIAAAALLFLGALGPALAAGTLRIQESDGSVRTYTNVSVKVVHQTLRIRSADGKGTLIVNQAACSFVGKIQRCYPLKVSLEQSGATKPIDLKRGTIYVNTSGDVQQLPLSAQQLPSHGILLSFVTDIGTYVTMTGKVDGIVR
ncbi:MAG: hypothetical protein WBD74_12915 [Candidatus Aquilonibacter sp.]